MLKTVHLSIMAAALAGLMLLAGTAVAGPSGPGTQPPPDVETMKPQTIKNVSVEPHGHFMIVSFNLKYATKKAYVELWDDDVVKLQTKQTSDKKKHWKIQVNYLDTNTPYKVKIRAPDPEFGGWTTYKKPQAVKTLTRNVKVTYRWVRVHDDSDPNSCGEMVFIYDLAGDMTDSMFKRFPSQPGPGYRDICDGESWDPSDKSATAFNVKSDTIKTSVLGVDNDETFQESNDCGYSCKSVGEWSEGSQSLDVGIKDYTIAGEQYSYYTDYYVSQGSGNPRFTWYIKVDVSYS